MFIDEFPDCCGAFIVYDFDGNYKEDVHRNTKWIKEETQNKGVLFLAILASYQRGYYEAFLIAEGFALVSGRQNVNSGNMIYLYVKGGQSVSLLNSTLDKMASSKSKATAK